MSTPRDVKTVIGLFRVSTEEQEQEGNSLEAQERMFKWDCRSFGWKSLGIFSGQETGTALDARATIHEVIAALRQHHPDALWVREQSRLTRGDHIGKEFVKGFGIFFQRFRKGRSTFHGFLDLFEHFFESRIFLLAQEDFEALEYGEPGIDHG